MSRTALCSSLTAMQPEFPMENTKKCPMVKTTPCRALFSTSGLSVALSAWAWSADQTASICKLLRRSYFYPGHTQMRQEFSLLQYSMPTPRTPHTDPSIPQIPHAIIPHTHTPRGRNCQGVMRSNCFRECGRTALLFLTHPKKGLPRQGTST